MWIEREITVKTLNYPSKTQQLIGIIIVFQVYPLALRCAIQLNDMELVQEVFSNCKDPAVQKQLAFILGRQVCHKSQQQ